MSDKKQNKELNVQSGKTSLVMQVLHYSVVLKQELSRKAKLSVFQLIFILTLTYGYESWVMTRASFY